MLRVTPGVPEAGSRTDAYVFGQPGDILFTGPGADRFF
jgi:hypothetical protein